MGARRTQARVYALTWLSYASYYLTRKHFSVVKKDVELELGISRSALGWIDTGYLVAYAVGQFIFGRVSDRVGARMVLVLGMLATVACSWWFGLSSSAAMMALAFGINGAGPVHRLVGQREDHGPLVRPRAPRGGDGHLVHLLPGGQPGGEQGVPAAP